MDGMEPDARAFLKKIMQSVFIGLFWMILNMALGIFFGLMFVEDRISVGNIIYYIFLAVSLAGLIWFYYRTWKHKFPHG